MNRRLALVIVLSICILLVLRQFSHTQKVIAAQNENTPANSVYESVNRSVTQTELDPKAAVSEKFKSMVPPKAQLICSLYGEAPQGGNAFSQKLRCPVPAGFQLNRKYRQEKLEGSCAGGGATTPLQPADIPAGYHIVCDGGHYWAVLPPIDQIALIIGDDGTVRQWGLDVPMYCGPGGGNTGGCNIKVWVYAVHL